MDGFKDCRNVAPNAGYLFGEFHGGGGGSSNPFEDTDRFIRNYALLTRSIDDTNRRFEETDRSSRNQNLPPRSTSSAVPFHSLHHQRNKGPC
ncbi:hypothetical protein MKW98_028343 [Papaver atlanticum]|uniref:Uncharacterized protein n=1 Tax=Papaver atlanticum TaxID=357466 RepID=A0AAD4SW29_9MAGN|nr:hypothetical protein MKW98_028343 [Papaver atlanticum]